MILAWLLILLALQPESVVVVGHELARVVTDAATTSGSEPLDFISFPPSLQEFEDICRKGNASFLMYALLVNQPCEVAYFRNEKSMGMKGNFNATVCFDDKNAADENFQIGDSFPIWDPTAKTTSLLNRTDLPWWPDLCIGFVPRCYSLGDETYYEKVRAWQRAGLIPPIPDMATHIQIDCREDFLLSVSLLSRAIPVGLHLVEKCSQVGIIAILTVIFAMIGCTCWSCFCCCWCVRRRQLKRDTTKMAREGAFVAVNPDEVNNAGQQQQQFNDQGIANGLWRDGLRQRRRGDE